MKARRQQVIVDLVSRERLSSQFEIRERLATLGIDATQSTISRDIEELGLAKVHDQGGLRYVTSASLASGGANGNANGNGGAGGNALRRLLREYVLTTTSSQNLLVIQTPPGAAHLLAEGLDRAHLDGVAGTVAGDNTILVVAREGIHAREVDRALTTIMEENG
jgi:transcriptional regulator of arginine metabolism